MAAGGHGRVRGHPGRPADAGGAVHRVLVVGHRAVIGIAADIEPVEYRLVDRISDQVRAAGHFVGIAGQRDAAVMIDVGDQIRLECADLRARRRPRQGDRDVLVLLLILVEHLRHRISGVVGPVRAGRGGLQLAGRGLLRDLLAHLREHLRDRGRPAEVVADLGLLGGLQVPGRGQAGAVARALGVRAGVLTQQAQELPGLGLPFRVRAQHPAPTSAARPGRPCRAAPPRRR